MRLHWSAAGVVLLAAALGLGVLLAAVWRRRGSSVAWSLGVVLLGATVWSGCYVLELVSGSIAVEGTWGDLKYVGIGLLPPAWLAFSLQYTGKGRLLRPWLVAGLAVEPLTLLVLLAVHRTHDLVRFYRPGAGTQPLPVAAAGPLFWVHLGYTYLLLLGATGWLVVRLARVSRVYRRQALALIALVVVPLLVNALYNFGVGVFARVDLTPFAFTVTGVLLVWGVYRVGLLNVTPVARRVVVETMGDPVVVLDGWDRIADVNRAARAALGPQDGEVVGRPLAALAGGVLADAVREAVDGRAEVTLGTGDAARRYELTTTRVGGSGLQSAGRVLVLRDVTERARADAEVRRLLDDRSRIARTLQASLLPPALPEIPGAELAASFRPAKDGTEVGGDFYDAYPVGDGGWVVVLGDVSGKGAEAAATTALVRYTLRAAALRPARPSELLAVLNEAILRQCPEETYCTVLCSLLARTPEGLRLLISLGGHLPPLCVRADGTLEPVGIPGTAPGLLAEPDFDDVEVMLAPGDALLAFTDGLTEARRGREQFGDVALATVLAGCADQPAADVVARLESAVGAFEGGDPRDDRAMLVVRCALAADRSSGLRLVTG